jgi:hypothetical protein
LKEFELAVLAQIAMVWGPSLKRASANRVLARVVGEISDTGLIRTDEESLERIDARLAKLVKGFGFGNGWFAFQWLGNRQPNARSHVTSSGQCP